jgi:hypothetical protein
VLIELATSIGPVSSTKHPNKKHEIGGFAESCAFLGTRLR